jgi:hypothetical protein
LLLAQHLLNQVTSGVWEEEGRVVGKTILTSLRQGDSLARRLPQQPDAGGFGGMNTIPAG